MTPRHRSAALVAVLVAWATVSPALAGTDERAPRSFAVPDHGTLVLMVPGTWKQKVKQPPEKLPPTIEFAPARGDEFTVLITPLWNPSRDPGYNQAADVRRLVEGDLRAMLPGAVEQEVPIGEIAGVDGSGSYFLVTDKAPKPGEYPYALRAGIGVGNLLLSVTVLTRSKDGVGVAETLVALRTARQTGQ